MAHRYDSNDEEWKTVGKKKTSKPRKTENNDSNAAVNVEKKKTKREPTALDFFIRGDNKKPKVNYDTPVLVASEVKEKDPKTNGVEKKKAKPKAKPVEVIKKRFTNERSFEKDVKAVRVEDIRLMINESKTHFPDSKTLWLKDIATYINVLVPYHVSDPVFSGKQENYPFCLLNPSVVHEIKQLFKECSSSSLQLFQDHCIDSVVKNMTQTNLPTAGYLIALQILAENHADVASGNVTKLVNTGTSIKGKVPVCLTLMWVCQQFIRNDSALGLRLWFDVIYPLSVTASKPSNNLTAVKATIDYAITCLESFFDNRRKRKDTTQVYLTTKVFLIIFDFIFDVKGLTPLQTLRLRACLTPLEDAVISKENEKLRDLFKVLLLRFNGPSTDSSNEVKACLKLCVSSSPQLVLEFSQSHALEMTRLLEEFGSDGFMKRIPKQVLRQAITCLKNASGLTSGRTEDHKNKLSKLMVSFLIKVMQGSKRAGSVSVEGVSGKVSAKKGPVSLSLVQRLLVFCLNLYSSLPSFRSPCHSI